MEKRHLFVILMILLIFVSAASCDKKPKDKTPFKGGTLGVNVKFDDNAPPSSFFQDQGVPIRVIVENQGEYDLSGENVKVKLFGVVLDNFGLDSSYKLGQGILRGKSEFVDQGDEMRIELGNLKYSLSVSNFKDFALKAQVCYPYETKSQIKTCVSSVGIEEGNNKKVCALKGEKVETGDVSSAPIQITSLTEEARGNGVVYNIKIENKGNGQVYDLETSCEDLEDAIKRSDSLGRVFVMVEPESVVCRFSGGDGPSGLIELKDGVKILSCSQTINNEVGSVEEQLSISLGYKYLSDTSKNIKIYESQN